MHLSKDHVVKSDTRELVWKYDESRISVGSFGAGRNSQQCPEKEGTYEHMDAWYNDVSIRSLQKQCRRSKRHRERDSIDPVVAMTLTTKEVSKAPPKSSHRAT